MYKHWKYRGNVDITIGDDRSSIRWRRLAISILLIIVGCIGIVYYYRNAIYVYLTNPDIILPNDSIILTVYSNFNANDYMINMNNVDVDIDSSVDTSTLGTYKVTYAAKNEFRTNKHVLTVNVVDKEAPVIELTTNAITIVEGDTINADDYVASCTDNYDKDITYTYEENGDSIVYKAVDSSGNSASTTLYITKTKKVVEQKQDVATSSNTTSDTSSNTTSDTSSNTTSSSAPYIAGVHNITVRVGTSLADVASQLTSGVHGSGYVSLNYSSINLTTPGVYAATFTSSDGVTETATVTVIE